MSAGDGAGSDRARRFYRLLLLPYPAEERRRQDARMRADFADGNVHVVDGWMLSEYEVETLGLDHALPLAGAP